VRFAYPPEDGAGREVLRGLSLHVRAGERVALLGESGAGKSTLLGLVNRTFDPTSGAVRIDGMDVRHATLASLRSQVGVVQQDTFLFHASVRDNVRFARPDATDEQILAALAAARALEFVSELPQGLDTVVGERGVKLSGGQRQRLSIARTLLADPPMLLLDEPTSAVDPESEALIVEALERLLTGRTALIVTHRPSLARSADRVLIVRDGQVVEERAGSGVVP
jgi:ABC-type multidrug transport system fused ATPase/permease subunit